uniref:Dickkopf N-terminal cysteine-rich domain-containing protein n=1 Tax=Ditylenchus dipsaci TaxID=166011 RepID=A0A915DCR5_9BILA
MKLQGILFLSVFLGCLHSLTANKTALLVLHQLEEEIKEEDQQLKQIKQAANCRTIRLELKSCRMAVSLELEVGKGVLLILIAVLSGFVVWTVSTRLCSRNGFNSNDFCRRNDECRFGSLCLNGRCSQGGGLGSQDFCRRNEDCIFGSFCLGGRCSQVGQGGNQEFCRRNEDCRFGSFCQGERCSQGGLGGGGSQEDSAAVTRMFFPRNLLQLKLRLQLQF